MTTYEQADVDKYWSTIMLVQWQHYYDGNKRLSNKFSHELSLLLPNDEKSREKVLLTQFHKLLFFTSTVTNVSSHARATDIYKGMQGVSGRVFLTPNYFSIRDMTQLLYVQRRT